MDATLRYRVAGDWIIKLQANRHLARAEQRSGPRPFPGFDHGD
jgi:hypothetical protein